MAFTILKNTPSIDFVGKRHAAYALSVLCILAGFLPMLFGHGLKLGIDFAGGVIVQVQFAKPVDDEALKKSMDIPELPGISTQRFGEGGRDFLLRFSSTDTDPAALRQQVNKSLAADFPGNEATIQRLEVVGPKIGEDLTNKALEAMYYATLLIAVYISGRFEQRWLIGALMAGALWGGMYLFSFTGLGAGFKVCAALAITMGICWRLKLNFALGAVVGLLHDVAITIGLLALLGKEIDLNVMAAIMTVAGYSLNDTIIVYDRIRENLRKKEEQKKHIGDVVNDSVNQTLSRTILTGATTLMSTLALLMLGGGAIHDFSLTMFMGVIVGTFSSIYVSAPVLMALGDTKDYVKTDVDYEKPGEHGIV